MNKSPLVSIVAVCFNHAKFLYETLDSILNQTYKNIQLIIIDDCSSDDSVQKIEEWIAVNNVICEFIAQKENKGLCANLNEGLLLSKGEFYQSIACDDVLKPQKIEMQVAFFQKSSSEVKVVCSNFETIDSKGDCISKTYFKPDFKFSKDVFTSLLTNNNTYNILVHSPTVLIRRSVFESVGVYHENLKQEDFYMWLMISREYSIDFLNEVLVSYRVLSTSLSKQFKFDGLFYFERLNVSSLFLGEDTTINSSVIHFQRKQLKKVFKEGIHRKDVALVNKGLEFFDNLVRYNQNLNMDYIIFQVFLEFPELFKNWSMAKGFSFEKKKYTMMYTLLKVPFLLKIGKPLLITNG